MFHVITYATQDPVMTVQEACISRISKDKEEEAKKELDATPFSLASSVAPVLNSLDKFRRGVTDWISKAL